MDHTGADIIKKIILPHIDCQVIPIRYEIFYVHPFILICALIRYFNIVWLALLQRQTIRRSDFLTAYYWAILDQIKPKVVITFIDTISPFYRLARLVKTATFMAIQNGNRWLVDRMPTVEIPHYFCFGDFEALEFPKHGHHIDFLYPVGSVKGDYAARSRDPDFPGRKFDLVFVSQWRNHYMLGNSAPEYRDACFLVYDFLFQFVNKHKVSLAIACAVSSSEELQYFRTKFGAAAEVFPSNVVPFSTYRLMQSAEVIITKWSTAGVEALGWGKKTLFCNFTPEKKNGIPIEGVWSMRSANYSDFESALLRLVKMPNDVFIQEAGLVMQYFMKYPPGSKGAAELIAGAVNRAVESPKPIRAKLDVI